MSDPSIYRYTDNIATHESIPDVIFPWRARGRPCSSNGAETESVCRTVATMMNSEASAKCLPGQMLC